MVTAAPLDVVPIDKRQQRQRELLTKFESGHLAEGSGSPLESDQPDVFLQGSVNWIGGTVPFF